jgi:small subunit ribosomal protein S20
LANIKSARKRARQAIKRRGHNMSLRSRMRTQIKKVLSAVSSGNKDAATAEYKAAVPEIDKIANKGLIHGNQAARHKSRLNTMIKGMS